MQIGVRLKQARLEAGLSQRQLCGDTITRNMLSQIENGSARPSMDVLKILAGRLEKPMSFFLEEEGAVSVNQGIMAQARRSFAGEEYGKVRKILEEYRQPDAIFDPERNLMEAVCCLRMAGSALTQKKTAYAVKLLEEAGTFGEQTPYFGPELRRQRLLLLGKAQPELASALPSLDEELMLRSRLALASGDGKRASQLLEAAENRTDPDWCMLRGEAAWMQKQYGDGTAWFHMAEEAYPDQTAPWLERCYREMEDYKKAYFYACKQKQQER